MNYHSYNTNWPKQYLSEVKTLKAALGSEIISIDHIGSTSIPGCTAKPMIDIMLVLPSLQDQDRITHTFATIGYSRKNYDFFMRLFFCKEASITFQLHVFQNRYSEIERFIKFKNWLKKHPDDLKEYIQLKTSLARKYTNDLKSYSLAKEDFVSKIEYKAGWSGVRLINPYTQKEVDTITKAQTKLGIESNLYKRFIVKKASSDIGLVFVLKDSSHKVTIKFIPLSNDLYLNYIKQQIISDLDMLLKNNGIQKRHIELSENNI
ncbi:GrpB family protein [Legionella gresilensis]|uniref:GrpB family protein n=1 Tax=Legionella gresilensis TaxID=91823 RepID=UPI0010416354|nr:GrpB family protein [Legionella gresilensis]